jgi:hypothetical protein
MNRMFDIISGMGILIAIYLFVKNFNGTVKIINALAGNSTKMVEVLQGR